VQDKQRGLYRNPLSYFGGLIVIGNALLVLGSMVVEFSLKQPSPYLGIWTYMIFPGFLTLGALVFLYGMRRESLRRRKLGTTEALPYPRLDLNDARTRKRFGYFLVGGGLFSILLAFVGYNAFLFTESVTFCGRICHTVMEPEYQAYLNSPHARVRCVDCHVGAGAEWYVKSKMSGLYQVYAVTTHSYETPIPTPVKSLRPARETCEECHWPQKFYGAQLQQLPHYRYDEQNTPEMISLLVKTGGGQAKLGHEAGIHWHMVIGNTVTFAATDEQLQDIPWVSVKDGTGKVTEYRVEGSKLSDADLAKLPRHTMDCMDCHNRPSHNFPAPETGVDRAMQANQISPTLPWIKKVAVDALSRDYKDRDEAHRGIREAVEGFYKARYPDVSKSRSADVEGAVSAVDNLYDRSVFPAMKVNWKTYNLNIGHRNWNGCFRCHDGRHATKDGKVLSRDCTLCHTMPERGPMVPLGAALPASNEPWHPFPLQGKHADLLCTRCHAAGFRPTVDCAGCHKLSTQAPMMAGDSCLNCHPAPGVLKPLAACASCHGGSLGGLHLKGGHPDASCTDCHSPHLWNVTQRSTCLACHEDKKDHNAPAFCGDCHEFGGAKK